MQNFEKNKKKNTKTTKKAKILMWINLVNPGMQNFEKKETNKKKQRYWCGLSGLILECKTSKKPRKTKTQRQQKKAKILMGINLD